MAENQKLKDENSKLKNDFKDMMTNLSREKDNNARITQEVTDEISTIVQ